jgi:hypothetical protein
MFFFFFLKKKELHLDVFFFFFTKIYESVLANLCLVMIACIKSGLTASA